MPPTKRSEVWKYFTKELNGHAVCKLCSKKIKTCNNTTNLRGHLDRMHLTHISIASAKQSKHLVTNTNTKDQDQAKDVNDGDPRPHSRISDTSTISISQSQATIVTVTEEQQNQPSTSSDLVKYKQSSITSSFCNIQHFRPGGKKDIEITNNIGYMIAKDNLPFSFVEAAGFRRLLHKIVPLYAVPSRRTITRLIDSRYEILSDEFKARFENIDCCCLTTDIWTEPHQSMSYLGITVHFRVSDLMTSRTIGVFPLEESHTAAYISEVFTQVCQEWNIDFNKVISVVTDNGSNIVKGTCDTFGVQKHVRCFAHTLNLVAENSLKAKPFINGLIEKIKKVVKWFKKSNSGSDALRISQLEDVSENQVLKLIQCVETRWNSKFYMIERFLRLRKYVNNVLLNEASAPEAVNGYEFNILKNLKNILQPLEILTREVSSDKYVTLSKIIPLIHCMENEIEKLNPQSEEVKDFQEALKTEIEKRFGKMEYVEKLAIATIVDPRFKKIHFKDFNAAAKAVAAIRKKLTSNCNNILQNHNNNHPTPMDENNGIDETELSGGGEMNLWNHHNELVSQLQNKFDDETEIINQINAEVSQYLNSSLFPLQSNPLQIWNNLKLTYPYMYDLATQYLQIPATSVPAERLFSKAGQILNDQRSKLKPKRLSKLLFLSSLDENEWDTNTN